MKTSVLKYLILFSALLFSINCILYAEENEYNVKKIPVQLIPEANAVIRKQSTRFEIKDESSAVEKDTLVVTIFNKEGQEYGILNLFYDKFIDIDELDGRILDSKGEEIRDLGKEDLKDYSAFSSYSLYEDDRVKAAELFYDKFPYTIEYTYQKSFDGYINWPSWFSRESTDPVELSRFEVLVPDNYKLRYWCNNKTLKPQISEEGKLYTWQAENLIKLSYDAVGESIYDVATAVKIAPSNFEIEGYQGSMKTWKDFGLWVYNLYKDKTELSESALKEIKAVYSSSDSDREKVFKAI